jgi:hypothetical protein
VKKTNLVNPRDGELARHLRAIEQGEKELPKSDAKRQHFVAQFHLGEFTDPLRDDWVRVVQLDIKTGRPDRVRPDSAASRRRFYTVVDEDGEKNDWIESFLALVETYAAPALRRLEKDPLNLGAGDRQTIAIFLALQGSRTPIGLEKLEAGVQTMSDVMLETMTEDPEAYRATFRHAIEDEADFTDGAIEEHRKWMIEAYREGRITMTNKREQALELMLSTADDIASQVYAMTWVVVYADEGEFITSDHPLSMFDPTPRFPWSGTAWASSPNSETVFPLSPRACLLVTPGPPRTGREHVDRDRVDELNLRTYGFAHRHIFGRTQETVAGVRRQARKAPQRVARARPNYQIVLEEANPNDPNAGAENAARGWPRFLLAPGPDGKPTRCTYKVMGYSGS